MLDKQYSTRFKKDIKKFQYNLDILRELNVVLQHLLGGMKLPEKYRDHSLSGEYVTFRECHIRPDVLLIYRVEKELLYLYRLGSHSELF